MMCACPLFNMARGLGSVTQLIFLVVWVLCWKVLALGKDRSGWLTVHLSDVVTNGVDQGRLTLETQF